MSHPEPSARMRCAVIGAGAWGTAIADRLARNGHAVQLWAREDDVVASVNGSHTNARFLTGVTLAPTLRATSDMGEAVRDAVLVMYAAPSHVLRDVVRAGAADLLPSAVLARSRT
jgi:glycerol-3-phosphate dehydrogenase (NAD(P)+)